MTNDNVLGACLVLGLGAIAASVVYAANKGNEVGEKAGDKVKGGFVGLQDTLTSLSDRKLEGPLGIGNPFQGSAKVSFRWPSQHHVLLL